MQRTWLSAVAAILIAVLLVLHLFFRWRRTNRKWILPNDAAAMVRRHRTRWMRTALWLLSWPHILDKLLRTRKIPVALTPKVEDRRSVGAQIYHFIPDEPVGDPVLIVHSLVSRPWILDLTPGSSLIEALVTAGRNVYLLDWGDPSQDDAEQGLNKKAWFTLAAIQHVGNSHAGSAVHLVGYCSGATVALIAASQDRERLGSMTLIAPMVDFAVPGGMQRQLASRYLTPVLMLDPDGCVPAALIRESFHMLRPMALKAARARWDQRKNVAARTFTGALTRWTWEQRRLGGGVFFDLVDLFRTNALFKGDWRWEGREVDLTTIDTPTLLAVTDRDHIVPIAASLAVTHLLAGEVETFRSSGGHVSMVASPQAQQGLYPALVEWFDNHDAPRE